MWRFAYVRNGGFHGSDAARAEAALHLFIPGGMRQVFRNGFRVEAGIHFSRSRAFRNT
jgi:hypothetical protein